MSINPPPPQYKGADLDPARGPGLGCFWLQVVLLAILVVLTPIGAIQGVPEWVTVAMFAGVIVLLFFVGQTAIFLLRLVSADRRGRRRPLAARTPTVGELESADVADSGRGPGAREDGGRKQGPAGADDPRERPSMVESDESGVRE